MAQPASTHPTDSQEVVRFVWACPHGFNGGRERVEGLSLSNHNEVAYCLHLYGLLLLKYPHECLNVGIIAPYRAQRLALKRAFQGIYTPLSECRSGSRGYLEDLGPILAMMGIVVSTI